jgi:hypothetical protein
MPSISNLSMQLTLTEAERTANKLYILSAPCFTFLTQICISNYQPNEQSKRRAVHMQIKMETKRGPVHTLFVAVA